MIEKYMPFIKSFIKFLISILCLHLADLCLPDTSWGLAVRGLLACIAAAFAISIVKKTGCGRSQRDDFEE